MRIDLHAHCAASDGTSAPAEVVRRAHRAGLDVLALTDHDTVSGLAEAAAALPPGLTLVPGAEISCFVEVDGARVSLHLLGYLFDPDEPEFASERRLLRTDRERRARAIVDRLVDLGVPVSWEQVRAVAGGESVGRPHLARAMVDVGAVPDVASAFTRDWLGHGGRAYVERYELAPARALELIRAAGGVAVFAHPLASSRGPVVGDDVIVALARAGLAGIEVDHPDHTPDQRAHLRRVAHDLDLVVTGSSDDHGEITGHRLGCETTDPAAYERLVAAATGAAPIAA